MKSVSLSANLLKLGYLNNLSTFLDNSLGAIVEKVAYFRISFALKGFYLKPFWSLRGVLWA